MAYRIEVGEPATEALRRIAGEQIDKALDDLGDDDRHEAVHEFRKRCKKIRALLRLARPALGDTYSAENRWFRDAARTVSDLRDATSMIETCDSLLEQHDDDDADEARRAVAAAREALVRRRIDLVDRQDPDRRIEGCRDALKAARERVSAWRLDAEDFEAFAGGLKKTYARARKARETAYLEMTIAAFHEWRKRVKYHRYHVRLLRDTWREVLDPWREELHALSDLLGDDHDLAVLHETVEGDRELAGATDLPALTALVLARRATLEAAARPVAARLLDEKPRRLVDRHRSYWEAARSQTATESALETASGRG